MVTDGVPMLPSPELESPYEVALNNLDGLVAWAAEHDAAGARNEATTRLHLIDRLLIDCLNWREEEITAEAPHGNTYVDYLLGRTTVRAIVEAKREGVYFELPVGIDARTISLRALRDLDLAVGRAVDQALSYCLNRGVPIGVVTNGHQLIAFIGSRQDGVPPADGRAVVFDSLGAMRVDFRELWNFFSRPGLESHTLYAHLIRWSKKDDNHLALLQLTCGLIAFKKARTAQLTLSLAG